MSRAESTLREEICSLGRSMFDRRLTPGSSGNISARLDDGWLMTPTGSMLGELEPDRLAKIAPDGTHLSGDKPTKETFLHMAVYEVRPQTEAVVHLHSSYSVALSVMEETDPEDALPPITAYYVMRIGKLPMVPYFPPGDKGLADAMRPVFKDHKACLLANHGPVVADKSLRDAVGAMEELEETAKLHLMLRGIPVRTLTPQQVADLRERFPI
ncbi:aldolase [Hwanghaeella grinnelliae]|uniref:3-oxo-tetronate 4-phosphate decarboxylase n=1 Tax=Hwanghaeella grinnelliae TaxID=2500179 RepID=A0A3S2VPR6_9PROT|nr:3-oxo-tetronate 4-phosphate decarboxylase [Hwanghaeella grinnelliae]RVU38773.1 aldolase [Hwanghaeella grinnelliae]